jgi:hypothetical protein
MHAATTGREEEKPMATTEAVEVSDMAALEVDGGTVEMTEEEARALGIDEATDDEVVDDVQHPAPPPSRE